jgi:hypothetical protein
MEIALIKTNLKNQKTIKYTTATNSSKKTEKPKPQKNHTEEQEIKKDNSPHSNWSLHNNPPRELRNIIPEMSTQNMPAQPQSIIPLVNQHRSHSCNIKIPVLKHNHKHNKS